MVELKTDSLTELEWTALVLAVITGIIHLFLGVSGLAGTKIGTPLAIAFLLAGLGFFGAIALVVLDYRRRLLYAAGVPYTAIQIVLWYVINFDGVADMLATAGAIGYVDKAVQLLLVVLLAVLYRRRS